MQNFRKVSILSVWGWLAIFALTPIALVLISSFFTPDNEHFIRLPATINNYAQLFNTVYLRILLQSILLATSCTIICLIIAYPFAYIVARIKSHYRFLLLLLIIIPFWTSSLIRTYAIIAILKTKGILNSVLLMLGIIHHPLHILYSYTAVLIGTSYTLLPFMILPIYANLEKFDNSLIDAARDLGAGKFRIFVEIILPLSTPGIIAGSILVFLPAMTMFYIPVLLGGAKDLLLGNLIENEFLITNNWPMGAAISVFVILLMGLSAIAYRRNKGQKYEDL
ncbi:MAG: ABC transporter permease subunit [Gammaproteobacteria bacterium]|nr:ABC transporter permease subunit [Gammaproteobacteria bacterium]